MLLRTSNPSALAVSLADAKAHCRIDHGEDDALLGQYLAAATRLLEDMAQIFARPINLELRQDDWSSPIALPAFPVRDVTGITYLDEDHAEQTLSSAAWYWNRVNGGAEVRFDDDVTLPDLSNRPQAVRVAFSAGFDDPEASGSGDDAMTVPDERVAQAILVTVGHWYENRETVVIGVASSEVALAFDALARQLRVFR